MAAARLRRLWIRLHRWVGLSLGVLLLFSALTGTLLLVGEPIDEALRPNLYEANNAQTGGNVPLDSVLQRLRSEFGPSAAFTFRPPREAGETLQVFVSGPWNGTVFFEPSTGEERGRLGQTEGIFNTTFALHSTLLANEAGRAVLALSALAYTLLLATGLVLWWPRLWRNAFRVQTRSGLTRTLFDLHRVGGAALGGLVLVSVLSGAYMAWRPLSMGVSVLAGSEPVTPPQLAEPAQTMATVDASLQKAQALIPDGRVGYVQVPPQGKQPLRVRFRVPDDPHPNGLSSVWLHPQSHAVLAVHRWNTLDPGTRAYSWIYPLHIGELGGKATWWLTLLAGLSLCLMGVSGLWLWSRRRQPVR